MVVFRSELLQIFYIHVKVSSCGYVMCVMAVFWCTEAIPIALTAVIPIVLLPMLGILTAKEVCAKYMKVI